MQTSILHVSLVVANTELSLQFYHHILGFPIDNNRPNLGFPGAWINIGEQQIHLLEVPAPTQNHPTHGGRDRHVAIGITNLTHLMSILETNNIPFTESVSGRKAFFCRDPDGNALEFIQPTV